jgi:hypothetical protein
VAATAAGDGAKAASAWRALGVSAEVTPGGMPLVEGLPPAAVRVAAGGPGVGAPGGWGEGMAFEVVGVQPLSPCHGVVRTATFREAPCDFGDVILWDPAPVAVREDGTPVFPLLEVLRRGDERRFRFVARQQSAGQVATLGPALPDGATLFIHHERIDHVCPRCAAGDSLVRHEHAPAEEHRVVHGKLVAGAALDLASLRGTLEAALRANPAILMAIPSLHEALGDTAAAGRAHKAWGGIERTVPSLRT